MEYNDETLKNEEVEETIEEVIEENEKKKITLKIMIRKI